MSTLCFILIILTIIIIPTLIYTFFILLKLPPNPFCFCFPCNSHPHPSSLPSSSSSRRHRHTDQKPIPGGKPDLAIAVVITDIPTTTTTGNTDANNDSTAAPTTSAECPVCLSPFEKSAEEEEIWQLNLCKHVFHASCIDRWLQTHSNCPVCRGYVAVAKPKQPPCPRLGHPPQPRREDDLWQGLPNSAGLV